jgi:hypothetical protein
VFPMLTQVANPELHAAQQTVITVTAAPDDCSFQFNPVGSAKFTKSCDITKALLARGSVNYSTVVGEPGTIATVKIGETEITAFDGAANATAIADAKAALDGLLVTMKESLGDAPVTALVDTGKALATAKAAAGTAEKALAKATAGTDDAAKTAATATMAEATAAVAAAQAAMDAARTAIAPDALAQYDAASAAFAKENGVKTAFEKSVNDALIAAGYPLVAENNTTLARANHFFDIFTAQKLTIVAILTYLILLVTMVYGPIAAMLVELFPTRIRYSGLSLPYHIGNGWFGGLMPATAFAISAQTGSVYGGLWYPIVIALMTVVIGAIFVPGGTHKKSIFTDDPDHKFHR